VVETDEYDRIFSALKHPIRRQILFLLEEKSEASFTEIQNAVHMDDTGLLSYHLKELTPLVTQSARGRYSLSDIGLASMMLFRKVEREREKSDNNARKYVEKVVGEIVLLPIIIGIALMSPLSVDIYLSVQAVYSALSIELSVLMFLAGTLGMVFGVVLFIFYDRHYFSQKTGTVVAHSLLFAVCVSSLSIAEIYVSNRFGEAALASGGSTPFLLSILRTLSFLGTTPIIAYVMSRFLNRQ
jgi:DNA-binding transcriptional ArsR family regulator